MDANRRTEIAKEIAKGTQITEYFEAPEGYVIAYAELDKLENVEVLLSKLKSGEFQGEIELHEAGTIAVICGDLFSIEPLFIKDMKLCHDWWQNHESLVFEGDGWTKGGEFDDDEIWDYNGHGYYCERDGRGYHIYFAIRLV